MSELKEYRIRVTEKHTDFVWVTAESAEQAKDAAQAVSECEFECVYDCEVIECNEIKTP